MAYPKGKPKSEESKKKVSASLLKIWTPEKRKLISEKYSGKSNPFYGKKHKRETIEKLRNINTGKTLKKETIEKIIKTLFGNTRARGNKYKLTDAQKKRLAEAKRGIRNPAWRGGITPINHKIRSSKEYRNWRNSVLMRDNYTCQLCCSRDLELHVDHIKRFAEHKEERFNISNGRTLCAPCHRKTDTYGYIIGKKQL